MQSSGLYKLYIAEQCMGVNLCGLCIRVAGQFLKDVDGFYRRNSGYNAESIDNRSVLCDKRINDIEEPLAPCSLIEDLDLGGISVDLSVSY